MKPIAQQWQGYVDNVLPKNAPSMQIRECRMAFYAGAWAFYQLQMTHAALANDQPDEVGMDFMKELEAEMRAFAASMPRG